MICTDNLSDRELLNYALQNGMINMNTIQMQYEMNERKKYIQMHESTIWQSTDGKWYTYLPDINKKRKLIKRKTEDEILNEIVKYYKNADEEQTVEQVYYEWIERKLKRKEIQRQTCDRYTVDFNRFYSFNNFKNRKIRFINEDDLEDFIIDSITENNLTSKAYSNLRTITRGLFMYAKKKNKTGLNINNFFDDLDLSNKIFSKSKRLSENNVFSDDELLKIQKELESEPKITKLGILLAIYTGMRVGEIVALKWEDVFDDYIHINRHQIMYKDDTGKRVYHIVDCTKTDAGTRDVVIIPKVKKILKEARKINPFTEYVFEKNGEPVSIHALAMVLYRTCDKLNINRRGMHVLRKTYATRLINAGVDEAIITFQMGHVDFRTTKDYYYYNNKSKGHIGEIINDAICL